MDMRNPNLRSHLVRTLTTPLAIASMLAVALPIGSVSAATYSSRYRSGIDDYEACASGLLEVGLSAEDVATACGAALYPRDLSECVVEINDETAIEADDALFGCRRVRRPIDLATCVVEINDGASEETAALSVLDFCRRSLLPLRFSACVVGIRDEVELSTLEAMSNCIAAVSRPRNVLPSFVPIEEGIPTTPSRIELDTPDDLDQDFIPPAPEPLTEP